MSNLTLAVTRIGDLLLKNIITKTQDDETIRDVRLVIPEYQRPYKWTARNAMQLLDDIIEAKNNNKELYRVGTLILHKEGKDEPVYNIVDGQQRVITFSLLLYALKNRDIDINLLHQKIFDNEDSRRNIPNNLNAFERRIKSAASSEDDNKRETDSLFTYIKEQCELIVVITDDISEAFQFFDSQNARGKALYPHDLLKAYHLREMTDVDENMVERIVKEWERIPQHKLASFFGNYLYRIKEWIKGSWAAGLDEHNIYKFKGITRTARTPYAQFYKSAYSYADFINSSSMPFVSGTREVNAFQLNTPIIAGRPFFEYTQHYYDILHDIRDNSKYEGFYIKDNIIVKTLETYFSWGVGNRITRLLFDTALLLYVDRFCPATYPTPADTELFEQFVILDFIWAYSLRAQYKNLGWQSAQNYILELNDRDIINSLNIYKLIADSDNPVSLLSSLADLLHPLPKYKIVHRRVQENDIDVKVNGIYINYIHFFKDNNFYIE